MTLTLPDLPSVSADEVRLELACALYARRKVARGLAARLAGLEADAFEKELQSRGITNGYGTNDLENDLAALTKLLAQ